MLINGIKEAVEAFDSIDFTDEFDAEDVLHGIYMAITEETEHEEAIMLTDTQGYEEVGYDNFEPSDTQLYVYTDLYNRVLEMGISSLQFIAFAHLRYTKDENGYTFYKHVNQIIY